MHLNDSFGHCEKLHVTYHHHEQAAAIAAEAYARFNNRPALVCVTSGPGATNAVTGCLCAWMGSIPMLIISGQVRYPLTVKALGLRLRTNGEQEYDICDSVEAMTKYCEMISDPNRIRYCLEKMLYLAKNGRPGPVWLDVPLDIQSAEIETEDLPAFHPEQEQPKSKPKMAETIPDQVIDRLFAAKRPVLCCGMGIRLSGAYTDFLELIELLKIPTVTCMSSVDYLPDAHPCYAGRAGVTGDRAGNFAVQNSDFFLSIGSRLSYKQTGYQMDSWAKAAYKVMVDIDGEELKREYLGIDLPVQADAGDFIRALISRIHARFDRQSLPDWGAWLQQCKHWTKKYPVVTDDLYRTEDGKASIYVFYKILSGLMPENAVYVMTSGNSRVVGRQAAQIKTGQRVIVNHSTSPMGYCLPASIGTCIANDRKPVVLITGEGGFQMNLQELQTIKQNRLPVHIVVINNEGYHSIRLTQNNFFKDHSHVGIGEESGDLSFPSVEKLSVAYEFPYFEIRKNEELEDVLKSFLQEEGYAICQVFVTKTQFVVPKVSSKRMPDGRMVSMPLEDMAPFLEPEELRENMLI